MPQLAESFVAREAVEENLIPDGDYEASVADTAIRVSADGSEEMLLVEMTLASGAVIVDWLRINSNNQIAREIARKSLAQLCISLGIEELSDTAELHGQRVMVRVTTQRGGKYAARNRFAYFPMREEPTSAS